MQCSVSSVYSYADENPNHQLIFASELIRHGERTPHIDVPNLPDTWAEGIGQLTEYGILQEYNLGKSAKEFYVDKHQLLSGQYLPQEIYVRSSAFTRTLMSANSYMKGFYPGYAEGKIQPFTIHSVPLNDDNLMLGYDFYADIVNNVAHNNKRLTNYITEVTEKLEKWQKLVNVPISTLREYIHLGDALYIRKHHGKELPANLSAADIDEFNDIVRKIVAMQMETQELGALLSQKLINELRDNINNVVNNSEDSKKFVLYSGHDVTIVGLLSALGAPLEINPPYASSVKFLLFKNTAITQPTYHLELLYNNEVVKIPSCQNPRYCTLDEFNSLVQQINAMAQVLL